MILFQNRLSPSWWRISAESNLKCNFASLGVGVLLPDNPDTQPKH